MYYLYILTNDHNTTIYVGITNNIQRRIMEHKNHINLEFSDKYNLHKLVYYETYSDINLAIKREKQLKAGSRKKKTILIESINPDWTDLMEGLE